MLGERLIRRYAIGVVGAAWLLASTNAAFAACRVSDFMMRPLNTLTEIERLSFVSQMTQTEFNKFKSAPATSGDHYALISDSANVGEARDHAQAKIDSLGLEDSNAHAKVWAIDFLDDDGLTHYVNCSSQQRGGLWLGARPVSPGAFNLAFAHNLPVGVEKIGIRVIASDNIGNLDQLKTFLEQLGKRDFFPVQNFALTVADKNKPAVLIMRAGYETPESLYLPVYPPPDVH